MNQRVTFSIHFARENFEQSEIKVYRFGKALNLNWTDMKREEKIKKLIADTCFCFLIKKITAVSSRLD